jgi:hypothetical protein
MVNKICGVIECDLLVSPKSAKGLCVKHYRRLKLYGDPNIVKVVYFSDELDKLLDAVVFPEDYVDGCWGWRKKKAKFGYGKHYWKGKYTSAHRALYKLLVDDNISGFDVDHLCRNPECTNPNHMEVVTSRENTLRGISPPALNILKTECLNGHQYTPENTKWNKKGGRSCRECGRVKWRAYYYKRKGTETTGKWA